MQCQEKCEESKDCVGILYSYKSGYTENCYVCWNDEFDFAFDNFGFYRRPKGKINL